MDLCLNAINTPWGRVLDCYFISYGYVICKLDIYVINVYVYIEREGERHIYYMSIYRDGGVFLLYICILNIFPEQLLRMLGTTMVPIIKTNDANGMF